MDHTRITLKTAFRIAVIISSNIALSGAQSLTNEPYETSFYDDFDSTHVNTSRWQIAIWTEHGGQTGTDRCFVQDGNLNMVFVNDPSSGFLSAAIQTRDEFLYGTWTARLKPSAVPGVLNSMYTIDWNNTANTSSTSNGTKQEIDIEFLTYTFSSDSGSVHYAVHAYGKNSFNTNPDIPLSFNPSSDFHVWGFTITPDLIEWFVDSTILQTYSYSNNDIAINAPYQLKFNVWSAQKWINGPPQEGVESVYLIDWIRFTPYSSDAISSQNNQCFAAQGPAIVRHSSSTVSIIYTRNKIINGNCHLSTIKGRRITSVLTPQHSSLGMVFTFNIASFPSGCYCYSLTAQEWKHTGIFMVMR